MMLIQHSVNSDWLFNTQSRVLQADWFILKINKKATLNFHMSYWHASVGVHTTKVLFYLFAVGIYAFTVLKDNVKEPKDQILTELKLSVAKGIAKFAVPDHILVWFSLYRFPDKIWYPTMLHFKNSQGNSAVDRICINFS